MRLEAKLNRHSLATLLSDQSELGVPHKRSRCGTGGVFPRWFPLKTLWTPPPPFLLSTNPPSPPSPFPPPPPPPPRPGTHARRDRERFRFRRQKGHDQEVRLYKQPSSHSGAGLRTLDGLFPAVSGCSSIFLDHQQRNWQSSYMGYPMPTDHWQLWLVCMSTPSQPSRQKATTRYSCGSCPRYSRVWNSLEMPGAKRWAPPGLHNLRFSVTSFPATATKSQRSHNPFSRRCLHLHSMDTQSGSSGKCCQDVSWSISVERQTCHSS